MVCMCVSQPLVAALLAQALWLDGTQGQKRGEFIRWL